MSTRQQLLREIRTFLKKTKMSPTTFGQRAAGNTYIVERLKEGRQISIDTLDRIRAYIAKERINRNI